MILTSVDFPAPFSPTSAWIEFDRTVRFADLSATTAPNDLAMLRSWRAAGPVVLGLIDIDVT